MLDILSSLTPFLFLLYVTIPSPPSFSYVSRPLEALSDHLGIEHGEMAGSADFHVSFSCVMPGRSLGYSQSSRIEPRVLTLNLFTYISHILGFL
jgi:hypothetical protein